MDNFIELLQDELIKLKQYATKYEIARIKSCNIIYPNSKAGCVYGVMTGDCFSERAHDLIHLCCSSVITYVEYITWKKDDPWEDQVQIEELNEKLFTSSIEHRKYRSTVETMLFFAPEAEIIAAVCFLKDKGPMPEFHLEDWIYDRINNEAENGITLACVE